MSENKCEMCQMGMPILDSVAINEALKSLQGWTYCDKQNALMRGFEFKGFYKTMSFVNAVAYIAHQQGHHPDMHVSYNKAVIYFQTHEAGGITKNDIICARLVNALVD
jgi:4a-hydroxytetrahydrobiopterin dehydratase